MAQRKTERVMVFWPMLIEYDLRAREDALKIAQTGGFGCGPNGSYRAKPDGPTVVLGAADVVVMADLGKLQVGDSVNALPKDVAALILLRDQNNALTAKVAELEAEVAKLVATHTEVKDSHKRAAARHATRLAATTDEEA